MRSPATRNRSRRGPSRLASSRAASAVAISSWAVVTSAPRVAPPQHSETSSPSSRAIWRLAVQANFSASASEPAGRTMQNSSPPKRATSDARNSEATSLSAPATPRNNASPAGRPSGR